MDSGPPGGPFRAPGHEFRTTWAPWRRAWEGSSAAGVAITPREGRDRLRSRRGAPPNAKNPRSPPPQVRVRAEPPQRLRVDGDVEGVGQRLPAPRRRGRPDLGGRARARRRRARGPAIPGDRLQRAARARTDRPRVGAPGDAQDGSHPAARVGRVPRGGRVQRRCAASVRVQPVLRAVPPLRGEGRPRDAAGSPRGREAVHRLLGQAPGDLEPRDRRGRGGRTLRRRARREQLHLRRGDAHAEARRLRDVDDPRARVFRSRSRGARARSAAQRRIGPASP